MTPMPQRLDRPRRLRARLRAALSAAPQPDYLRSLPPDDGAYWRAWYEQELGLKRPVRVDILRESEARDGAA